jgi:hypothetical protein
VLYGQIHTSINIIPNKQKSSRKKKKADAKTSAGSHRKKTKKQKQGFIYRSNLTVGAIRPCGPDIFFVQRNEPLLPDV